jgi:hypothetical protein
MTVGVIDHEAHPRPASAPRPPHLDARRLLDGPGGGDIDDGRPAHLRLRRQGGGFRRPAVQRTPVPGRRIGGLHPDSGVHRAVPDRRVRSIPRGSRKAGVGAHTPRNMLVWAPAVPAAAGIVLGLAPGLIKPLVESATFAVYGVEGIGKLVAWPGFVTALVLVVGSLTVGSPCCGSGPRSTGRSPVVAGSPDIFPPPRVVPPERGRAAVVRRQVLITHPERISPFYLGVILLVAVLLPTWGLRAGPARSCPRWAGDIEWLLAVVSPRARRWLWCSSSGGSQW